MGTTTVKSLFSLIEKNQPSAHSNLISLALVAFVFWLLIEDELPIKI